MAIFILPSSSINDTLESEFFISMYLSRDTHANQPGSAKPLVKTWEETDLS